MDKDTIKAFVLCFDKSPEEAVKFLESKGIKVTWNWQEQADAIREHCFTIAKCSSADILTDFLDELDKAMQKGETFQDFKKKMNTLLIQKGFEKREDGSAWRLDTIYRTNLQSAYMAGRYKEMKEVEAEFPYWEFVAVMDNRTTDSCEGLNGIVLPSNDTFWSVNYPPRHFKCRSRARAVSEFQMKKRGLEVSDSEKYKNIKPSEGFDNVPGNYQPNLKKYPDEIRNTLQQMMDSYEHR